MENKPKSKEKKLKFNKVLKIKNVVILPIIKNLSYHTNKDENPKLLKQKDNNGFPKNNSLPTNLKLIESINKYNTFVKNLPERKKNISFNSFNHKNISSSNNVNNCHSENEKVENKNFFNVISRNIISSQLDSCQIKTKIIAENRNIVENDNKEPQNNNNEKCYKNRKNFCSQEKNFKQNSELNLKNKDENCNKSEEKFLKSNNILSKTNNVLTSNKAKDTDDEIIRNISLNTKIKLKRNNCSKRLIKKEKENKSEEDKTGKKEEKSNEIPNIIKERKIYYYVVLKGNNSFLIKKCMSLRSNWKELPDHTSTLYHFKWRHISCNKDFGNLSRNDIEGKILNHFEYHPVISNKLNLFLNVMKLCEGKNIEVFKYIPLTIVFYLNSPSFQNQYEKFEKFFYCIHNHLGNSKNIGEFENKKKNFSKYSEIFKLGIYNSKLGYFSSAFIEETHYDGKNLWLVKAIDLNRGRCIKIGDKPENIKKIIENFAEGISRELKSDDKKDNELEKKKEILKKTLKIKIEAISKSSVNSNKDIEKNNIKISQLNSDSEKKKEIENQTENSNPDQNVKDSNEDSTSPEQKPKKKKLKKYKSNVVIVQKYIEKPLLYWGRKFDIRMWVLIDHNYNVYVFKEGHLKTSSIEYNLEKNDLFIHLTNYSVQKYGEDFGKQEQGNEVSFKDFQNMIDKNYGPNYCSVRLNIYEKIKYLVKIATLSGKEKLNMNERKFCFEIYGFDFMIDKNFDVFLLEVNTNPGLEESSELIKMLVSRMIDDTLRITIDKLFETKYNKDLLVKEDDKTIYFSPFKVDGYEDTENLWDFVINIKNDDL